jgi:DNA-directed RNA polymerase subunit RPC12/RpoP
MELISTSWSCARCGAAFISIPPEHGLCEDCLAVLEAQITAPDCPTCGGPVCIDCGQRMVLAVLVPCRWPPPSPPRR